MKKILGWRFGFIFGFVFSAFFVPAYFLSPSIESFDDTSYLSHAFTIGLDFDLDYSNEIATTFIKGRQFPVHPIGSGLLAAPFVAVFGILDRVGNHLVINERISHTGSWAFFGFLFAVNLYFLTALFLYWSSLNLFNVKYSVGVNLLIMLSTGVIYYVLGRFTMSHGFEFFSLALCLYTASKFSRNLCVCVQSYGFWCLFNGLSVVLSLLVRSANLPVIILPYLVLLMYSVEFNRSLTWRPIAILTLSLLLWLIPYGIWNYVMFGDMLPEMDQVYGNNLNVNTGITVLLDQGWELFKNTALLLFGTEVGIIYSNPIIVLGFLGAIIFGFHGWHRSAKKTILIIIFSILYIGFFWAIVLVWRTTASDYGYRYLFPLIPICALYFVVGWRVLEKRTRLAHHIYLGAAILLFIVGILNVCFYKVTPSLSPQDQVNMFGREHSASLNRYEVNLLEELGNPTTYILVLGKSYFGFLVAKYALKTNLVDLVADRIKEKYFPRFIHIPWSIYVQTFILLVLWGGAGFIFGKIRR